MAHSGKYRAGIYRSKGIKQRTKFQGALIGCTETAFCQAGQDTTQGATNYTEQLVRMLSGEWPPDPASPGLNQTQLLAVAKKLHISYADHTGKDWAQLVKLSRENRRLVCQLWYSDIGGGNIGHAVTLREIIGNTAVIVDPITGVESKIPAASLRKGMERLAEKNGIHDGGLYFGGFRACRYVAVGAS